MRQTLLAALLLAGAALFAQDPNNPAITPQARALHDSAIVIDTHADTPQRFLRENYDIAAETKDGHIDLPKIRQGGLGAEFFAVWVPPRAKQGYAHYALELFDGIHEQVRTHPDDMVMAYSADDIVRARTGPHKRLAVLIGVEGGHAIENDIRVLRDFYRLGARYMTLTWANTNEWADSSGDQDPMFAQDLAGAQPIAHHNGLTDFGKQVVLEMNRLGMMVDISHVSDKTFWDAIAVSRAPVIASHSDARALSHAMRNLTDDMLKAVAKNGGVVMANFSSDFLDENYRVADEAASKERRAAVQAMRSQHKDADEKTLQAEYQKITARFDKVPRPPLKSLIDNIDHIAKVAGVDHVGLGSDFDGISSTPLGIDSVADLPKITQSLLDRGYTPEQIKKILGGNLLRVFRQVEQVSKQMRAEKH